VREFAAALRLAPARAARWYLDALPHRDMAPFARAALEFESTLAGGIGSGDQHVAIGLILLADPEHAARAARHLAIGLERRPTSFGTAAVETLLRDLDR
jgi:hypothetical protein